MEVANNQHISIGSAKRQVLGANKHPESTYASMIKQMKIPAKNRGSTTPKPNKPRNSQITQSSPVPVNDDTNNQPENKSTSGEMNTESPTDLMPEEIIRGTVDG